MAIIRPGDTGFPVTPVQFLEEDARGNRFYIKREDLLPFCFGGNKLRIGAAYVEDFLQSGATRMITYGNNRSNLCRVLSVLCAARGIPLTILRPADEGMGQPTSFNRDISEDCGAENIPCTKQNVAETVDAVFELCRSRGEIPYYTNGNRLGQGREELPPAAIAPLWAELCRQEAEMGLRFALVGIAAGTGMTLAGLAAGEMLLGDTRPLLGVSTAREASSLESHTLQYLHAWQEKTGCRAPLPPLRYMDQFRLSYGKASPEIENEIRRMMRLHGIPLDPTYTAKGWWGLKAWAKGLRGQNLLFIHTGGTPLYFDWLRDPHE